MSGQRIFTVADSALGLAQAWSSLDQVWEMKDGDLTGLSSDGLASLMLSLRPGR